MAAWLEGLAAPNTEVMRHVTARLAQGVCALEDVGAQVLKGVAEPRGVFRVRSPTVVAGVPCLVGRDEAMGVLVRRWEQSTEGLGQVVLGGSGGCVPENTPCDISIRHTLLRSFGNDEESTMADNNRFC